MTREKMRRTERQITDSAEILNILSQSQTIRLGLSGTDYPYVVPVSFGMEVIEEGAVIYFHGSQAGLKSRLLGERARVCVECDSFLGVQMTETGITTRYESVIGFGECEKLHDDAEKIHGLEVICSHYNFSDYPIGRCKGLKNAAVYRICLINLSGKRNLPEE